MRHCWTSAVLLLVGGLSPVAWGAAQEQGENRDRGARAYDVFQQIRIATFADLIMEKIQEGAAQELAQRRPGESAADYEIRQKFTQTLVRSLNRTIGDVEDLQVGWRLDRQQKRTYIDLNVNARRSSQLAERVSQLADQKTQFGGFLLNGAVLKANWLGQMGCGRRGSLCGRRRCHPGQGTPRHRGGERISGRKSDPQRDHSPVVRRFANDHRERPQRRCVIAQDRRLPPHTGHGQLRR